MAYVPSVATITRNLSAQSSLSGRWVTILLLIGRIFAKIATNSTGPRAGRFRGFVDPMCGRCLTDLQTVDVG